MKAPLTEPSNHCSIDQRIRSAQRWRQRALRQSSCEGAYSDLLLATKDFGIARGYVDAASRKTHIKYEATLADLEESLLAASHRIRPKCRT